MAYDEYRKALLDLEAVAASLWVFRLKGWEKQEPAGAISDPVLRFMAREAIAAPLNLYELEQRAIVKFGYDHASDRANRLRSAEADPDFAERAHRRRDRARPTGVQPFAVHFDLPSDDRHLRPALIDGLLRRGETCNVIAPPKIGKSWLVHGLALDLATGTPWLGRRTEPVRVLIIDNELHQETLQYRLAQSMHRRQIDPGSNLDALSLRGGLKDLYGLCDWLKGYPKGQWDVVIVDAFYRCVPKGKSENDNAEMAGLYNHLDSTADELGIGWMLVHHTSKGNQAEKGVTDVGSGAGSMSRAADTHMVLRRHREENCVVLDAVTRSFAPPDPVVLEWSFPRWITRDDLDPADLDDGTRKNSREAFDLGRIVDEFVPSAGIEAKELQRILAAAGCSQHWAREACRQLEKVGQTTVASVAGKRWFSLNGTVA